jgi:hypothetical protein
MCSCDGLLSLLWLFVPVSFRLYSSRYTVQLCGQSDNSEYWSWRCIRLLPVSVLLLFERLECDRRPWLTDTLLLSSFKSPKGLFLLIQHECTMQRCRHGRLILISVRFVCNFAVSAQLIFSPPSQGVLIGLLGPGRHGRLFGLGTLGDEVELTSRSDFQC